MQTRAGSLQTVGRGSHFRRRGGGVQTIWEGAGPPGGLANPSRGHAHTEPRYGVPCKWAQNPGRVGQGGQGRPCRERVGGLPSGLAQAPADVWVGGPMLHAWDTFPAHRVLTSRAQHLEQLEVLHAHLLLMPSQIGCTHRVGNEPSQSLTPPCCLGSHGQAPGSPSVIRSSTSQPSSSSSSPMADGLLGPAQLGLGRAAPVTWRLRPGRALPGAASGAEQAPSTASRLPAP